MATVAAGFRPFICPLFSTWEGIVETTGHGSVSLSLVADIDPVDYAEAGPKEE